MNHAIMRDDVEAVVATGCAEALGGATVLVTGAGGFVASYVVWALLRAGAHVVGLVRDPARATARLGPHPRLSFVVSDLSGPLPPLPRIDAVLHAASPATPRVFHVDPVGTLIPNVVGTYHLLEAARAHPVRAFVFISSGEVYGVVPPERIPMAEGDIGVVDPFAVRSCYAEGKRVGETLCKAWAHQHGVPTTVARVFHTYGPGMALDDGRVQADFVADAVAGRDIVLKSDGRAIRPFCYVADVATGLLTLLSRGERGEVYNVGNEDAQVSIVALAELVAGLFPERGMNVVRGAHPADYLESPIPRNAPDTTRLRALGWAPRTGLSAGFRRTIESYAP